MSDIVSAFPLIALITIFAFMFGNSAKSNEISTSALVKDFENKLHEVLPEVQVSYRKSQFFECDCIAVLKMGSGRPVIVLGTASRIKGMKSDPFQKILLREYSISLDDYWINFICDFIKANFSEDQINDVLT